MSHLKPHYIQPYLQLHIHSLFWLKATTPTCVSSKKFKACDCIHFGGVARTGKLFRIFSDVSNDIRARER